MNRFWPAWIRRHASSVSTTSSTAHVLTEDEQRSTAPEERGIVAAPEVFGRFCICRRVPEQHAELSRRLPARAPTAPWHAAHVRRDTVHVGRYDRSGNSWSACRAAGSHRGSKVDAILGVVRTR